MATTIKKIQIGSGAVEHVYMLKHARLVEEGATNGKLIGFYSSMDKVNEVIERYKHITGFKDYPDDFVVEEMEVDFDDFDFI